MKRCLNWLLIALSAVLGMACATAAFFLAAFLFNDSFALFGAAFCIGFSITALGVWISVKRATKWKMPGRLALGVAATVMLVLWLLASLTILKPLPSTLIARQSPPIPSGVRYWNLSTGSHIAYLEVHAEGKSEVTPIIIVGGGPGEAVVTNVSYTQFFAEPPHG
jgi:proline iminopeptidase